MRDRDLEMLRFFRDQRDEGYLFKEFLEGRKGPLPTNDILSELLGIEDEVGVLELPIDERLARFRSDLSPQSIKVPEFKKSYSYFPDKERSSDLNQIINKVNCGVRAGHYRYILYLVTPQIRNGWYIKLASQKENDNASVHDSSHSIFDLKIRDSFGKAVTEVLREGILRIDTSSVIETQKGGTTDRRRHRMNGTNKLSMWATVNTHFQYYNISLVGE